LIAFAGALLVVCGIGCALAGCVPFAWIQPLGELIRRPDDVTRERYVRYLAACWFLAVWSIGLGTLVFRNRRLAGGWFSQVTTRFPGAMKASVDRESGWGIELWIVITLGIGLRLIRLDDPMAYDESYTFLSFARRPWYEAIADYNSPNNHLLNTFLMHWSYRLFGTAEWALRLPVLLAGVATLLLTPLWAQNWLGRRPALVCTALVAISPLMITYSVDARGYMFVAAAALAVDHAAALIDSGRVRHQGAWIVLTLAATLGLCALPIMLYSILGTALWFLLAPAFSRRRDGDLHDSGEFGFSSRVVGTCWSAALAVLFVAAFYAPSFLFRGLMFAEHPVLQGVSYAEAPAALRDSLAGAWAWWTEGAIPMPVWGAAVALGLLFWPRKARAMLRLAGPFVVVVVLNLVQHVAPPPRVYLFLFPWVALLAARGVVSGIELLTRNRRASKSERQLPAQLIAFAVCIAGGLFAMPDRHPVLFYAQDRAGYVSIRNVLKELKGKIAERPREAHRLIVPLPCDLPALFYREREKMDLEINGQPQPEETLWVVTRREGAEDMQTPEQVFESPLINLPEFAELPPSSWIEVKPATPFRELRLYRLREPVGRELEG
jgi:hypothetical protein